MFGAALRLIAAAEAGRRVGDYAKNLVTRNVLLSSAGKAFLRAIVIRDFGQALTSGNWDPVTTAGITAGNTRLGWL